ncbi:MAG: beta-galactosidase [Candidatus Promineifilaceae bacterium]|nr:beta-galactosidase [Candidatus Promineifilaceae bacterium]
MRLGVCYYPEHWPEARWAVDARMMVESGLSIVRIAEFAWVRMEPALGEYDWGWLDRAIDVLSEAGLQIVLGTPTATPPAWLTQQHPQMLRVDANGRRRKHGSRRQCCLNDADYRRHSTRIVEALVQRYGADHRIIGWQIDNEFGGGGTARCYCPNCATAFRVWLRKRYGSLPALNEDWGTVFWSQTYNDWQQIQVPDEAIDKHNPSQALDYYRFSSDSTVDYQQLQIDILERSTKGFVTTNFMGLYRDLDQFDLAQPLDFITWDSYPTGNSGRWRMLLYPPGVNADQNNPVYAYDAGDAIITSMAHALMRGLKDKPFWIMEQQCGLINWGDINTGIRPGTTRLWTWHALAEGANTCIYFRWRPTLFAQEQYHSGLLRHDGQAAQGLRDVHDMQGERELMAQVVQEPFRPKVAMLVRYDDLWALELQPQRKDYHYLRHYFLYYMTLMKMGVAVNLLPETGDLSPYALVLAPTLHMPDDALVGKLTRYVQSGGTLLVGVRSGFKTTSNLVTDQPLPGLLRQLTGVTISSWQALPDGFGLNVQADVPGLLGQATYWFEILEPQEASVVGRYEDGRAALTSNEVGSGIVYTLGWYPDPQQARALLSFLCYEAGLSIQANLPDGLLYFQRGRYQLLLNFTDEMHDVVVDGLQVRLPARDLVLLSGLKDPTRSG